MRMFSRMVCSNEYLESNPRYSLNNFRADRWTEFSSWVQVQTQNRLGNCRTSKAHGLGSKGVFMFHLPVDIDILIELELLL